MNLYVPVLPINLFSEILIPALIDLQYNKKSGNIVFRIPNDGLCLRIQLLQDGGASWRNYSLCEASTGGSVKLADVSTSIIAVQVFCCLLSRPDICGPPQNASIGEFLKSVQFHLVMYWWYGSHASGS